MRRPAPQPIRCAMRKHSGSRSIIEIARVVSLAGFISAGAAGAFIATEEVALASGIGGGGGLGGGGLGGGGIGGGGIGSGGAGSGIGGTGIGSGSGLGGTGIGSGTGTGGIGGIGLGAGTGTGATGSGSATGVAAGAAATGPGEGQAGSGAAEQERRGGGFFTRLMRSIGLGRAEPEPVVFAPSIAPKAGVPALPAPPLAAPRETQAFRFDVGTAVFPTTGGVLTTEQVDGVDVVTVDAWHHRVIHPAAFFEPHDGARYDRRAVERFWPIALGKRVRFVETVGKERWLHVMSAVRAETVSVPPVEFRTFVV